MLTLTFVLVACAAFSLGMYLLGIVAAFAMAWLFKKTLLRGETPMLLLEMPPYRMPAWRTIIVRMWERGLLFLRRAGTVISQRSKGSKRSASPSLASTSVTGTAAWHFQRGRSVCLARCAACERV